LRLLEALRIFTISNTAKDGMRRMCSDLVIMIKEFSLQAPETTNSNSLPKAGILVVLVYLLAE
jgi:hypothetical protein